MASARMVEKQEKKQGNNEEKEEEDDETGFEEMGLDPRLLRAISKRKLVKPTPIQSKAIPLILQGKDVVARAKTGSGKTLAYLLPLVHKILGESGGNVSYTGPRAFVLVPTRELCQQVHDDVRSLFEHCGGSFRVVQLTNSMSVQTLTAAMAGPPDVVVATPARISACIQNEILLPSALQNALSTLVLDEVHDDVRSLFEHCGGSCSLRTVCPYKPWYCHPPNFSSEVSQRCLALLKFELIQRNGLIFVNSVDTGFRLKMFLEQYRYPETCLNFKYDPEFLVTKPVQNRSRLTYSATSKETSVRLDRVKKV